MVAPAEKPLLFLVDDDDSVRRSLRRLLSGRDYDVEDFPSAQAFLDRLPVNRPACAVLDLAMPEMDGLKLQRSLNQHRSAIGVVFLTGHGDIPASVKAMKQGAIDFLTKPVEEDVLVAAVENALLSARDLKEADACFATLSPREREVMQHVVAGMRNKQIAGELGITEKTVKVHRAHIMEKTGAKSVAELVQLCMKAGITAAA